MALGAAFGNVAGFVYRSILGPSATGLAIGVAASTWLARLLEALLFGVRPANPRTMAAATGPALRAACSDPAGVLRRERAR